MNDFKRRSYKKNNRGYNPTGFLIFLILILVAIIIYTLVTFSSEPDADFYDEKSSSSQEEVASSSEDISSSEGSSSVSKEISSSITVEESSSEVTSSDEVSSSNEDNQYYTDYSEFDKEIALYSLGEQERVTSSYFDDAVFFGDSITEGISLYDLMSNSTVIAFTGINPQTVFTRDVIATQNGKVTMVEALKSANPAKIYVMLGSNGIEFIAKDTFIENYDKLLKALIEQHPNATIYVQSILPVTHSFERNRPNLTNQKINEYNLEIAKIAKANRLTYLNVAECFKDEYGVLPESASPSDGMHFGSEYYQKWFEYLRKHAIQ